MNPPKRIGLFEVYDAFTQKLIGTIGEVKNMIKRFYDLEYDDIFIDIHDRVIYSNEEQILVYKIYDDFDTQTKKLILNFELKLPTKGEELLEQPDVELNIQRRIMPQRKVKMRDYYEKVSVILFKTERTHQLIFFSPTDFFYVE